MDISEKLPQSLQFDLNSGTFENLDYYNKLFVPEGLCLKFPISHVIQNH